MAHGHVTRSSSPHDGIPRAPHLSAWRVTAARRTSGSQAVPRGLGYRLDRIETDDIAAATETGRSARGSRGPSLNPPGNRSDCGAVAGFVHRRHSAVVRQGMIRLIDAAASLAEALPTTGCP